MPAPKPTRPRTRKPSAKPAQGAASRAKDAPASAPVPDESLHVQVRGLAVGGSFAARVVGPENSPRLGMTAFVPFVAPGETADVRLRRLEDRFIEADLETVDTPSPDRATPPCPYFGTCGGCDIQHLAYPAQLQAKADMVRGALTQAKLPDVAARVLDVVPGPPLGYRRRIALHLDARGRIGYFARRTHTVLPVQQCPIAQQPLSDFLSQNLIFDDVFSLPENFPKATPVADVSLEAGSDGVLIVVRVRDPKTLPARSVPHLIERLAPHVAGGLIRSGAHLVAEFGAMSAPDRQAQGFRAETARGIAEATAGHFTQVNPEINQRLIAQIETIARDSHARTACDLYTGAGNFALPLAALGIATLGVEEVPELVAAARAEAARRQMDRVAFQENTVELFLQGRPAPKPVDLIIADPPRAGLGKLASHLMPARDLVLISCDLASAVRDLRTLTSEGWEVASVTPYDMFAQTAHVELVTHLKKG